MRAIREPSSLELLASLGPVLALERIGDADCCCRWFSRACRAGAVASRVSLADGPQEELVALDVAGRPCARVMRLPDSDYYAWERAIERFAPYVEPHRASRAGCIERRTVPRWRGRIVRIERAGAALVARPLAFASTATTRAVLAVAATRQLLVEA